jgi:hypothetical protein
MLVLIDVMLGDVIVGSTQVPTTVRFFKAQVAEELV